MKLKLAIMILMCTGCSIVSPPAPGPRPSTWATPVSSSPGLPNLNRINANLYRSAQPTLEGFRFLGTNPSIYAGDRSIKTIISLRAFNDDKDLGAEESGLRLEQIYFNTWHAEDADVIKFLRIATTPGMQPVLVHCKHGSDRTGTMVAIYRIVVQGWPKVEAMDEMVQGGYGFHPMWQNLLHYIGELDVETIKVQLKELGDWKE